MSRGNVFAMAPGQKLRVGDLAADADVFKSDFEMFSLFCVVSVMRLNVSSCSIMLLQLIIS